MPRQLRNKGGITSIVSREKYGLGSKIKERILFNSSLVCAYTISLRSFKIKIMICGYEILKIISYEEGYNAKWERIQISKEEKPSGGDNYNKQHQKLLLYV